MFGTIRREATDPSAHRNAWSGAQQQQQQQHPQQQQHQHQQDSQQQQLLQHPLPHHGSQQQQQQQQHPPLHQHHPVNNQQPDHQQQQAAAQRAHGTSNMTVVSNGGSGSAVSSARAARSSPMVQMAIAALVSINSDHPPSSEMLSLHEDILDAAARAWDAGYHWSISIFAIALRAIIRDVAAERRHKFGSSIDPAYIEKVTCVIQTRFLAVDPALGVANPPATTSTQPPAALAATAAAAVTVAAAAARTSPQPAVAHLPYHHDVQATAAAALAAQPLTAPSITVKASPSPSPALSSSVLVPPAVRVLQPPPPPPPSHHGHSPPPPPGQTHPNKLPAIQPQPAIQPRPQLLQQQQQQQPLPGQHQQQQQPQQGQQQQQQQPALLPLPRLHRQPLPQGPPSQQAEQEQDQTDPPGSPPAKRRRPLPTVGVHSWAVANGNNASGSPPGSKTGSLAPPEGETISAKRRRRRSDRGGDPGAYRNVGGYGDVTASGYGYGYTGTVKCTMPPCEWTAVTTSMRMGLRLNDHLLRKHGVENSAIRLRPSYIRRMPRSHAAMRVVKERPPYRSAREALIRLSDSLAASSKDFRVPDSIGKLREERAREVFPHTDDVKSMSGKDLREELVRMRTGDGMQAAAAAIAAETARLGMANHKDSPLEVWSREHFLPWQASVKEVDPAALAASESAQLGTKSPETMNRWLENHFRPWESKDGGSGGGSSGGSGGGGDDDDGPTIVAAGAAPRDDDEGDNSKGEGEDIGPSDEELSDVDIDDENDA